MSFKKRDRVHFSSLFWAPKTSERKSQFHSFSLMLLICEQRQTPSNKQAKDIGAWKRDHCDLFFGLGIMQHHSVTILKFDFTATTKKFWAAPKPVQWNSHKLRQWHYLWKHQLERAPGFPHVRAGGESWRPHNWLFGPGQVDKWWDTASAFCWCHKQLTQSSWYLGQWSWAFPWQNGSVPELCWAFVHREALGAFQQKLQDRSGDLRVSCHLPVFLVLGKLRKTITCGSRSSIAKEYSRTICPPCLGSTYL